MPLSKVDSVSNPATTEDEPKPLLVGESEEEGEEEYMENIACKEGEVSLKNR